MFEDDEEEEEDEEEEISIFAIKFIGAFCMAYAIVAARNIDDAKCEVETCPIPESPSGYTTNLDFSQFSIITFVELPLTSSIRECGLVDLVWYAE